MSLNDDKMTRNIGIGIENKMVPALTKLNAFRTRLNETATAESKVPALTAVRASCLVSAVK